jgi:ABC-type uncharacterized transport system ATPase subunit
MPMLEVAGISKSYGAVRALNDVSARFSAGEIHAVLGENGAGKSTLMHILSGFAAPDSGSATLGGEALPFGRPFECRRRGIAMIHQHFTLVKAFTVAENLCLAQLDGIGPLDRDVLIAPALEIAKDLGWTVDLNARTGDLPIGAQQRIEILKSLAGDAEVAIFDEPTAVLGPVEVEDLFRVLRRLKDAGKIVILIAHKLAEVMAIADRVTVLRRGVVVAEAPIGEVSSAQLAQWMVGDMPESLQVSPSATSAPELHVEEVSGSTLRGVSFAVGRGEILGIGGVDGNGQQELAEVLAGVTQPLHGTVRWDGGAASYIPEDRQSDGLALSMTIEDNLLIGGYKRASLTRGPFLNRRRIAQWASTLVERFDVRTSSTKEVVANLSGGNQQKVVIARALDETPDLLVAVNPTRGLDVKATGYVHRKIIEARNAGAVVVLISTDVDELAALASRTVYLSRGKIVEGEGAEALVGGSS